MKIFACVVAQDGERTKIDFIAIAEFVVILGRKIPIDTPSNPITLGTHLNGFGNLYPAVLKNANLAVKIEYALVGRRGERHEEQQTCREIFHSTDPNLMSGTLATSSDDF